MSCVSGFQPVSLVPADGVGVPDDLAGRIAHQNADRIDGPPAPVLVLKAQHQKGGDPGLVILEDHVDGAGRAVFLMCV